MRTWILGWGGCLGIVLFIVAWCYNTFASFTRPMSPLKQESWSPTGQGSAVLLEECIPFLFSGTTIWIFVWDRSISASPIRIDEFASDGQDKWEHGVWSRDGSVFAIVAHLGEGGGKKLKKDFGAFFVTAYDFRTHRRLPPVHQKISPRARSKQIATLIQQRGGPGSPVFTHPYAKSGTPLRQTEKTTYGHLYSW